MDNECENTERTATEGMRPSLRNRRGAVELSLLGAEEWVSSHETLGRHH
jgi:hypothetical protein